MPCFDSGLAMICGRHGETRAPLGGEVFGRHAPLRERTLDHEQQMIGIHRLGEKVQRAFLDGFDGVLNRAVRRHHHDRQLGIQLLGGTQHAEAVAFGEAQVRQDDAGTGRAQGTDGLGLVARFDPLWHEPRAHGEHARSESLYSTSRMEAQLAADT